MSEMARASRGESQGLFKRLRRYLFEYDAPRDPLMASASFPAPPHQAAGASERRDFVAICPLRVTWLEGDDEGGLPDQVTEIIRTECALECTGAIEVPEIVHTRALGVGPARQHVSLTTHCPEEM